MRARCLLLIVSAAAAFSVVQPQQHDQTPLQFWHVDGIHADISDYEIGGADTVHQDSSLDLDWNPAPHADATGNLIFTTVSSLLQQWPNTVIRPGHTIVPVVMPPGTIMYHGREPDTVPDRPDWLAFDFEHAYIFADETPQGSGHVLTFATRRPLKFIYFDGSSAAKVDDGCFDSQDALIHREVRPGRGWEAEEERIERLCAWAKPYGIDGFVRMEFHFEVMYCDFSDDGLELVHTASVIPRYELPRTPGSLDLAPTRRQQAHNDSMTAPELPSPHYPMPPKGWIGSLPPYPLESARIAGKWHDFAPGETRVRIDYSGLVTFYDPAVRSLVEARRGLARPQHRLLNISRADADMKVRELEEVMSRNTSNSSRVDWGSVTRIVMERYGQRLELLNDTLASDRYNVTEKAAVVRQQVLAMLLPYIARSDIEARHNDPTSDAWLANIVRRCSATQTSAIPATLLTKQELLIRDAIAETLHEICRRVARAFAVAFDIEVLTTSAVSPALRRIEGEVHALMDWLDWTASWVKCRPVCEWDEVCTVPTWPFRGGVDKNDRTPRCVKVPGV